MSKTKKRLSPKKIGDKLGINWKKHSLDQFKQGLKVETEHKDVTKGDPIKTGRIVFAHLKEVSDYYTRLKKVEKNGKKKAVRKKKSS